MKINIPSKMYLLALFSLLLLTELSCTQSQDESKTAFDLNNAKKEIEAANQNFMDLVSKGDSVGLANCYATSAKAMGPNAPAVAGKENIQSMFGSFIKGGISKVDLKSLEVWGTPEIVTEEGEFALYISDGTQVDKGKYIVVWKKEDGKWKILRDMFNSDLPVPAPK